MRHLCAGIVLLAAAAAYAAAAEAVKPAPAATLPSAEPLQMKIEAIQKDAAIPAAEKTKAIQAQVDAVKKDVGGKTWTMKAVVTGVKQADVTVNVPQLGLEGVVLALAGDAQKGDVVSVGVGCDVVLAEGKASLVVREMHLAGSEKSRFFDPPLVAKPDAAKAPKGPAHSGTGFFGLGEMEASQLKKIVYIIDRSGSMTDSIDYIKHELKRSLAGLTDEQEFHVIFFSSGPPVEMPTRRLVNATERNKQLAFEFIDGVVPMGETDPSKAIERAFACKPEMIFLLTDGEFDKSIVDLCKRMNTGGKVTVHTIQFLYSGSEVLKQIANDNGGNFKQVTEQDLANLAK